MLTSIGNVNVMKLYHENVYHRSLWHTFNQTLFLMIDKTMLSYSNRSNHILDGCPSVLEERNLCGHAIDLQTTTLI